jgi:glycosyltransferase involved in cell wall biosynthesis
VDDRVSVVIPTYNGAAFLGGTLEAVFAQTLPPAEICIVDDASRDGTAEVVRSLLPRAPVPVSLIALPTNSGGPARPINVGMANTRSPYVALCEQDDRMLPRKLELLRECLHREPRIGLAISRYRVTVGDELRRPVVIRDDSYSRFESMEKHPLGGPFYAFGARAAHAAALEICYAVSLSNMMVRRAAWEHVGGLDERIQLVVDQDFLLRVSREWLIGWVDEPLWEFHRHRHGLMQQSTELRCAEDRDRMWWREYRHRGPAEHRARVKTLLRENRLGCAYSYREMGRYLAALTAYARSMWETGFSTAAAAGMAKLLPHYLLRGVWRKRAAGVNRMRIT